MIFHSYVKLSEGTIKQQTNTWKSPDGSSHPNHPSGMPRASAPKARVQCECTKPLSGLGPGPQADRLKGSNDFPWENLRENLTKKWGHLYFRGEDRWLPAGFPWNRCIEARVIRQTLGFCNVLPSWFHSEHSEAINGHKGRLSSNVFFQRKTNDNVLKHMRTKENKNMDRR